MVFLPEAHPDCRENPPQEDDRLPAYAPGSDGFCLSPADIDVYKRQPYTCTSSAILRTASTAADTSSSVL